MRVVEHYEFGERVVLDLDKRNIVCDKMSIASYSYMEIEWLFYTLIWIKGALDIKLHDVMYNMISCENVMCDTIVFDMYANIIAWNVTCHVELWAT